MSLSIDSPANDQSNDFAIPPFGGMLLAADEMASPPPFAKDSSISSVSSEPISADEIPTQPSPVTQPITSDRGTPVRISIADWYSPEYHGLPNTQGNTVMFRAYIPWRIFRSINFRASVFRGLPHRLQVRPTHLMVTSPTRQRGLTDLEILNSTIYPC